MRTTYTYVTMGVSQRVFDEVMDRLLKAGYNQALHDGGSTLDMHGIALKVEDDPNDDWVKGDDE